MARYSRRVVLFLGIIFHLVQLGSIFDIYFVTPLVHGMKEFKAEVQAPAKRVFLVVGSTQLPIPRERADIGRQATD